MLFNIFFKEQVENIASLVSCLIFNMTFVSKLLGFFISLYLREVNACIFLDSVYHCKSFKRLAQVDHKVAVRNAGSAAYLICNISEHILGKIHHTVVVCVCLIKLHKSKFRVMSCINAFVSENTSDLVNSFKTADNKTL